MTPEGFTNPEPWRVEALPRDLFLAGDRSRTMGDGECAAPPAPSEAELEAEVEEGSDLPPVLRVRLGTGPSAEVVDLKTAWLKSSRQWGTDWQGKRNAALIKKSLPYKIVNEGAQDDEGKTWAERLARDNPAEQAVVILGCAKLWREQWGIEATETDILSTQVLRVLFSRSWERVQQFWRWLS
ncbi:unnamed protein product [Vitrella brassicaformis CCMP3155]|uniref:Uncharacterized protein n=1 Tax=Vitrella brassicaformis (strain CCMP3155) TaxID=1169540 RepID=A0A0G4FDU0_VITBC|nr:unnamed protein product [Vitrella brassicaformis CCMP3155]|eukprot:CEM11354.1 unnamed protein product [Vitrella brassicaformis CCMP3155]